MEAAPKKRKAHGNPAVLMVGAAAILSAAVLFPFEADAERPGGREEYSSGKHEAEESIEVSIDPEGAVRLLWDGRRGKAGVRLKALLTGEAWEGEEDSSRTIPFEWIVSGSELSEGCRGGVRLPSPEADDDGDGLIDEDPFDGRDNDGDGFKDEDFAAVGERMRVAGALAGGGRARVIHNTYTWSCEHAQDFAGFTTRLEFEDRGEAARGLGDRAKLHLQIRPDPEGGENAGGPGTNAAERQYLAYGKDTLELECFEAGRGLAGMVIFNADSCLKSGGRSFFIPLPDRKEGAGIFKVEWALVFAESMEEMRENASVAARTFRGLSWKGHRVNWAVPAGKTAVIDLEADLATVWVGNSRRRALVIRMPEGMAGAPVKWIRINGKSIEDYTRTGPDVLLPLSGDEGGEEDSVLVEGQLEGGVIFRTKASLEGIPGSSRDSSDNGGRLPEDFLSLHPNPFVENVNIDLDISRIGVNGTSLSGQKVFTGRSSVRIYDVKGLLVRVVMEREFMPPGKYSAIWDGTDQRGKKMAPGVYYCSLRMGQRSVTKRIILLR